MAFGNYGGSDFDLFGSFIGGGSSDSSGGSWWNTALDWGSKFFGGDSGSSSSNIFGGIMGGLNEAANSVISKEAVKEQGEQNRKTRSFEAALEDYYNQKNKVRKRAALDTYGQFSTMNRWAPNATAAPAIDQPARPNP